MKSSEIVKKALHKADGVLQFATSCNESFLLLSSFFVRLIFLNNHAFSDIL